MASKSDYLVDLIFKKLKNYNGKEIMLEKRILKKFISLPPTTREQEEKLEQLRIIDKAKISVVHIEKEILGVDTKEDLDRVNQQIQNHV